MEDVFWHAHQNVDWFDFVQVLCNQLQLLDRSSWVQLNHQVQETHFFFSLYLSDLWHLSTFHILFWNEFLVFGRRKEFDVLICGWASAETYTLHFNHLCVSVLTINTKGTVPNCVWEMNLNTHMHTHKERVGVIFLK